MDGCRRTGMRCGNSLMRKHFIWFTVLLIGITFQGCKPKDKVVTAKDLPDINAQIRPFVTTESTRVRTGPGPQFRIIAQIKPEAKVQALARDGDWILIVSKAGNPPGYI